MVFAFLRRPKEDDLPPACVPRGVRVYAVGDIHGRADLLDRLLAMVIEDARSTPGPINTLVFLGDYVDRGAHSREVIDRMVAGPPPTFGAIHLKGNHEAAMLDFLTAAAPGLEWLNFGGLATLQSYGVEVPATGTLDQRLAQAQHELRRRLPSTHLGFLKHLRPGVAIGDYFFTHAGVRPGIALDRQDPVDMMWIRDEFLRSSVDFGKIVVHGHTITPLPEIRANRIGIDTGAFASDRLTCLVLEADRRRFLST